MCSVNASVENGKRSTSWAPRPPDQVVPNFCSHHNGRKAETSLKIILDDKVYIAFGIQFNDICITNAFYSQLLIFCKYVLLEFTALKIKTEVGLLLNLSYSSKKYY